MRTLVDGNGPCKMKHRERLVDNTQKNCKKLCCISSHVSLNTAIDTLNV